MVGKALQADTIIIYWGKVGKKGVILRWMEDDWDWTRLIAVKSAAII